jgi:hypothetical protein
MSFEIVLIHADFRSSLGAYPNELVDDPLNALPVHPHVPGEPCHGLNAAPVPEARHSKSLRIKGNTGQHSTRRAQIRESVSQALERVRQAARQRKKEKFTALLHHISVETLEAAFYAPSSVKPRQASMA